MDAKSKQTKRRRTDLLLEDCRRTRAALMDMVSELKATRAALTSPESQAALDERIFNCECSIARFEIVIMETEARVPALRYGLVA
jgi:hypothetical protein